MSVLLLCTAPLRVIGWLLIHRWGGGVDRRGRKGRQMDTSSFLLPLPDCLSLRIYSHMQVLQSIRKGEGDCQCQGKEKESITHQKRYCLPTPYKMLRHCGTRVAIDIQLLPAVSYYFIIIFGGMQQRPLKESWDCILYEQSGHVKTMR